MTTGERRPAALETLPRPFGPYLLLERLAEGGMGEVFLAKHRTAGGGEDFCVLKKLLPKLTRDREYVTRFVDEARVVVTLEHPNICEVFDVGRVGEEYYLAMEYISGLDLRTILERAEGANAVLAPPASLHVVCELLGALDYAHKRRHPITDAPLDVVHRDVSPHNVIIGFDARVTLIDFGLASSNLKIEKTEPHVVMGKMAYMSPEQARGDPTDGRADQFAVAVMLYEMLVGERFYAGKNALDIYGMVGHGGYIPRRMSTLDPPLARLLERALDPDPERRFPSAARFRKALLEYLHGHFAESGEDALTHTVLELGDDDMEGEWQRLAAYSDVTFRQFQKEIESTKVTSESIAQSLSSTGDHGEPGGLVPDRARRTTGERTRVTLDEKRRAAGRAESTEVVRDRRPPRAAEPTVVVRERGQAALGGLPTRSTSGEGEGEGVRVVALHRIPTGETKLPEPDGRRKIVVALAVVGLALAVVVAAVFALR